MHDVAVALDHELSVTLTLPIAATRPTSLRARSSSMRCSARSFGSASSSASSAWSSSSSAPRRRVPASGRIVTLRRAAAPGSPGSSRRRRRRRRSRKNRNGEGLSAPQRAIEREGGRRNGTRTASTARPGRSRRRGCIPSPSRPSQSARHVGAGAGSSRPARRPRGERQVALEIGVTSASRSRAVVGGVARHRAPGHTGVTTVISRRCCRRWRRRSGRNSPLRHAERVGVGVGQPLDQPDHA